MSDTAMLKPVLVDAIGRSGTTVMMSLLASSPAVRVERDYPYESRYLTYFASLSKMLDGDAKLAGKWPRDNMLAEPPIEIGGLPWRQLVQDSGALAQICLQDLWKRFSEGASEMETHYIEKVSRWVSEYVPSIISGSKVVCLVRDPRDVWLSVAAFNAKRGYLAFGREENDSDEDYLSRFIERVGKRMTPILCRENTDQNMLIRYEDLIADTANVVGRLGDWLNLDLDASVLSERIQEHVTAPSSGKSVQRWKRELSRSIRKRFKREMGDILDGFGYE